MRETERIGEIERESESFSGINQKFRDFSLDKDFFYDIIDIVV